MFTSFKIGTLVGSHFSAVYPYEQQWGYPEKSYKMQQTRLMSFISRQTDFFSIGNCKVRSRETTLFKYLHLNNVISQNQGNIEKVKLFTCTSFLFKKLRASILSFKWCSIGSKYYWQKLHTYKDVFCNSNFRCRQKIYRLESLMLPKKCFVSLWNGHILIRKCQEARIVYYAVPKETSKRTSCLYPVFIVQWGKGLGKRLCY